MSEQVTVASYLASNLPGLPWIITIDQDIPDCFSATAYLDACRLRIDIYGRFPDRAYATIRTNNPEALGFTTIWAQDRSFHLPIDDSITQLRCHLQSMAGEISRILS